MKDDLAKLEARHGLSLPQGYRDWVLKGYTDYRANKERYLWLPELKEWLRPDEIPEYDLWRMDIIQGLVPFGRNGRGDNWCWNTQVRNCDAEYDVLSCWHDEELADRFAPTFPAWFYRTCLEQVCDFGKTDEAIDEARSYLRLCSKRLSEIQPGRWADHLLQLSQASPIVYHHPKLRAHIMSFGFITAMSVDEIVADQFGPAYLEQKVAWSAEQKPDLGLRITLDRMKTGRQTSKSLITALHVRSAIRLCVRQRRSNASSAARIGTPDQPLREAARARNIDTQGRVAVIVTGPSKPAGRSGSSLLT